MKTCLSCCGVDGHYVGCPELSEGSPEKFSAGYATGYGREIIDQQLPGTRLHPSFKLGFAKGAKDRKADDMRVAAKEAERAEKAEKAKQQEEASWDAAMTIGAMIPIQQVPRNCRSSDVYKCTFFTITEKGDFHFKVAYSPYAGYAGCVVAVQTRVKAGMHCFSKVSPPAGWTHLRVLGKNKAGTVLFVEPVVGKTPSNKP